MKKTNTPSLGHSLRIAPESGIPFITLAGEFFSFETSDGLRVEMSRKQIETLVKGFKRWAEIEEMMKETASLGKDWA